jgi:2-polyprenyl-3-methyl-5-hydroxy-6-metoxy-1,4-benzoquinol methylase
LQATVTPGVVDTQCGAKVAQRTVWDELLPFCRQAGFAWDAEVIAVALARGITVREVPIAWRHDDRSKVRVGRDGVRMALATGAIWTSARRATRTVGPSRNGEAGVFEGERAAELIGADRSHWWFRGKAAFVSTALARTGATEAGVLVDVGAGAGGVTAMLGWEPTELVLFEAGGELVRHARHVHGLASVQAQVAPLSLASSSVDVVCLLDVIEHLEDPAAALAEVARVLRPGGRLVVNVPAHSWLWSSADVYLGHHRRYNVPLLREELRSSGLEPILMTHVFSWLVPAVWVARKLRPSTA